MKLNLNIYQAVNEVIRRLNNMNRWTAIATEKKYNELAKQALNCLCAYMIAACVENDGQTIDWTKFPKIAIYRAFDKAYVSYQTPGMTLAEIFKIGDIKNSVLNNVTRDIIRDKTNLEFMEFVSNECDSFEYKIYRASSKLMTYMELTEQRLKVKSSEEIEQKMREIQEDFEEFKDIKIFNELLEEENPIYKVIQRISKLRNSNRWAAYPYIVECSVLCHLFDTGVFAYLIALETFGDEELATKFFFMGIYHDVAEAWTTDIPSTIKDAIAGFREATEKYELIMLEENLYKKLPDFLAKKVKEVIFEDEDNSKYKKLMKGADYLSADSECWREYIAGSREKHFFTSAIMGFDKQLVSGEKAQLPPIAKQLHNEMMEYSKKVMDRL